MDSKSVCFRCGDYKKKPLKMCPTCLAIPEDRDDKILSVCMSLECIKEENLRKCSKYIKKKGRCPNFKERVVKKAIEMLEQHFDLDMSSQEDSDIDFSTSFFEFKAEDLQTPEGVAIGQPRMIKANVIGRPRGAGDDAVQVALGGNRRTCHQAFWTLGKEISAEEYERHKAGDGEIYVRYRLMGANWSCEYISQALFTQLKSLEDGTV
ncbi:MAG: hypothetical protein AAF456_05865 [Planctomycetota bacterium]